ncbi:restriction endonuclease subunit S [Chryseobacterium sp.]|uniref:restriction endonuclease subunit S n=1 Tax=Chryseobacterium sp. TaxID=1871047 RepID=UPI00321C2FF9
MQRYEEYKDSEVELIGQIPNHWIIIKSKYINNIYNGDSLNEAQKKKYENDNKNFLSYISSKDIDINFSTINYNNGLRIPSCEPFKIAPQNTSLICIEGGSAGKKIAFTNQNIFFVNKLACFNTFKNTDAKYIYYSLKGASFQTQFQNSMTGLIGGVSLSALNNFILTLPPLREQKLIAKFLDEKSEKINAAIITKEQQIEKLKELRQVTIHQAVTKGIQPHVDMKDSEIDWIDKVPKHWKVKRLKYVFEILKRISGELGHDVLSITQKGIKVKDITSGEGQLAMDYSKYQFAYKGDFAMNHMDLLTGWVDISSYNGVISPDYRVFSLIDKKNNPQYFLHLLQDCYRSKTFYAHGQGVSMLGRWRFPTENFNNFYFPIPPIQEQKEIVNYLEKQTSKIDQAINQKTEQITKLKEYKQSLINEIVMGKIKVT